MWQEKTNKYIIQTGCKFLIIHTEYYQLRLWIWKNEILNLINHQPDIDEILLYAKNPYKPKYQ